jgi:nucleotide-binding universal stress UspA family protein
LIGLGRRLLGGITEQVLHRSDISVLVVSGRNNDGGIEIDYSRVLITTDGSKNADVTIPHGIAQRVGSTVPVLNVVDLQAAGGAFSTGGLKKEFVERLEARGHDAVGSVAHKTEESAPNWTVKTIVEQTTPFEEAAVGIREYVAENEIDLVVICSHGRSNLKRQLLGSVASTVLRTMDIPVLVVNRSN